ncbi:phage protein NinX family protein [Morganella morganii]|uniref:phage protein NinX family protein n=1 Tax=Morganella morganii TaxID=582 RepID=UPI00339CC190
MNKYRDKSDFEINKAVADSLGYTAEYENESVAVFRNNNGGMSIVVSATADSHNNFDPCNNPADAMPIIKDNLISLEHDGIAWMVSCVRHPEISVWDGCENYNDNFYRKAMELFLLMKDAENEK